MSQPNRGGMSKVTSEGSMRRYVSVLAEEVRKRKLVNPAPTMDDLAASSMVAPAPVSRKPGAKFQNLEDYLGDVIRNFNRELMGMAAAKSNWESLERLRRAEEVMSNATRRGQRVHRRGRRWFFLLLCPLALFAS
jgi:hypothetical protein